MSERYRVGNVETTRHCMAAAIEAGLETVILISSAAVYGTQSGRVDESTPVQPSDAYGERKRESEEVATSIASKNPNLRLVIIRPVTVIGAGDPGNVIRLVKAIDRNRFLWLGRGDNPKSFIARRDVSKMCAASLVSAKPGITVLNAVSIHASVREVADTIARQLGRRLPRWHVPVEMTLSMLRSAAWRRLEPRKASGVRIALEKWTAPVLVESAQEIGVADAPLTLEEVLAEEIGWYRSGCPPHA